MNIEFLILAFVGGVLLTSIVALLVNRRLVRKQSSLESDIANLRAHSEEMLAMKEASHKKELDDLRARSEELLAMKEESGKQSMDALQKRFDETVAKVTAQVRNDTSEMLKERQKEFSEASGQSIGQLVEPLKTNIAELRKAMEEGSKEQAERNGEMRERIKNLIEHSDAARKSADELAAAFKHGSKMQGDWGETILEELLAAQGFTKGVHFDTQSTMCDAGVVMRPDVILHLDDRRDVIIDSKVSLTAYVDYVNAENEADRQTFLKAHIESIKKHVKELAVKDYSGHVKPPKLSAGYVLMFVPNVGALWTALNAEPDLWRKAADANVYITDEQSLYGALKIVNMTWTQLSQAQNHEKVYELAGEMIERVGMFMERYEAVGNAIRNAAKEYDNGLKKLDPKGQSIINTSQKLIRLGAKNSERHPIKALSETEESVSELPGLS